MLRSDWGIQPSHWEQTAMPWSTTKRNMQACSSGRWLHVTERCYGLACLHVTVHLLLFSIHQWLNSVQLNYLWFTCTSSGLLGCSLTSLSQTSAMKRVVNVNTEVLLKLALNSNGSKSSRHRLISWTSFSIQTVKVFAQFDDRCERNVTINGLKTFRVLSMQKNEKNTNNIEMFPKSGSKERRDNNKLQYPAEFDLFMQQILNKTFGRHCQVASSVCKYASCTHASRFTRKLEQSALDMVILNLYHSIPPFTLHIIKFSLLFPSFLVPFNSLKTPIVPPYLDWIRLMCEWSPRSSGSRHTNREIQHVTYMRTYSKVKQSFVFYSRHDSNYFRQIQTVRTISCMVVKKVPL